MHRMNSVVQVTSALVAASVLTMGCPFQAETFPGMPSEAGGQASGAGGGLNGSGGQTSGSGGEPSGAGGGPSGTGGESGSGGSSMCLGMTDCVDTAPFGWTYTLVRVGDVGQTPQACPNTSSEPAVSFAGLNGGSAGCSACACGPRVGAACGIPELSYAINATNCAADIFPLGSFQLEPNICITPNFYVSSMASCSLAAPAILAEGSCTTSGGAISKDMPVWAEEVHACAVEMPVQACGVGQICVPSPSGAYSGLCIQKPGIKDCPLDWTLLVTTFATEVLDMRTCSPCGCDASGLECVGGKVTVYDEDNCVNIPDGPVDLMAPSQCTSVGAQFSGGTGSLKLFAATPSVDTCAPTGGELTGDIQTMAATTICCR